MVRGIAGVIHIVGAGIHRRLVEPRGRYAVSVAQRVPMLLEESCPASKSQPVAVRAPLQPGEQRVGLWKAMLDCQLSHLAAIAFPFRHPPPVAGLLTADAFVHIALLPVIAS